MDTFHLEILSPEMPFYKGDCISLILPISDGMIGIMAHHPAMTAVIGDGLVKFKLPSGEERECMVSKGMFDISRNDARLLCDIAATPEDWDKELERRKEEEARIEEDEKKARRDFMKTQLSIARAINALKIKNRNSSSGDRTLS